MACPRGHIWVSWHTAYTVGLQDFVWTAQDFFTNAEGGWFVPAGLYDRVSLTDGYPLEQRKQIYRAYINEARRKGVNTAKQNQKYLEQSMDRAVDPKKAVNGPQTNEAARQDMAKSRHDRRADSVAELPAMPLPRMLSDPKGRDKEERQVQNKSDQYQAPAPTPQAWASFISSVDIGDIINPPRDEAAIERRLQEHAKAAEEAKAIGDKREKERAEAARKRMVDEEAAERLYYFRTEIEKKAKASRQEEVPIITDVIAQSEPPRLAAGSDDNGSESALQRGLDSLTEAVKAMSLNEHNDRANRTTVNSPRKQPRSHATTKAKRVAAPKRAKPEEAESSDAFEMLELSEEDEYEEIDTSTAFWQDYLRGAQK